MIPTNPTVPLLCYSDPKRPKNLGGGLEVEIGDDKHTAIWGLYQFKTTENLRATVEARVLLGTWYNFCGGGRYFSPQVHVHVEQPPTFSWERHIKYCCPNGYSGLTFNQHDPCFDKHFAKAARVIPSLNKILGAELLDVQEVDQIMWDSLASATLGHMSRSNKRFWVGADRDDGRLAELTKTMKKRGTLPGYMSPIYLHTSPHSSSLTGKSFLQCAACARALCQYPNEVTEVCATNWNSGSECTMYTLLLKSKGGSKVVVFTPNTNDPYKYMTSSGLDECCPNCKMSYAMEVINETDIVCYECGHTVKVPVKIEPAKRNIEVAFYEDTLSYVLQKMSSPMYLDHIPYGLWGN